MGAIKIRRVFKGNRSALQCVLKTHAFAMSLCLRQKALLELHSVSGQLCVYVLGKPLVHSLSVCVQLSLSPHTDAHAATFNPLGFFLFCLSVYFSLTFCLVYTVVCVCSTDIVVVFLPLLLWPKALCKATRKGLLAMLVCASMVLYSFQKLPFLLCDLQS